MGWAIKLPSTMYAIRCSVNGKVYIGRTQDMERRMREHLTELKKGGKRTDYGRGYEPSDFQRDYNQYGENAFDVYILEENVAPEVVREREAFWIAEYRATDREYGYNRITEKPAHGLSNFKSGLPPKRLNAESIYQKFDRLSDANQKIVRDMAQKLLDEQEATV